LVEFTRAGWTNPTGINRSTLQRVRYRLVDNKLYRDYWGVLDRTLNSTPIEVQLLDKVQSVTFRFMDNGRQWQTTWPASQATQVAGAPAASFASRDLPIAIEVTINLQDWGEIKRLVEVPTL
jgi:general secretion pathway protein J